MTAALTKASTLLALAIAVAPLGAPFAAPAALIKSVASASGVQCYHYDYDRYFAAYRYGGYAHLVSEIFDFAYPQYHF
jgi:hypothetical protein